MWSLDISTVPPKSTTFLTPPLTYLHIINVQIEPCYCINDLMLLRPAEWQELWASSWPDPHSQDGRIKRSQGGQGGQSPCLSLSSVSVCLSIYLSIYVSMSIFLGIYLSLSSHHICNIHYIYVYPSIHSSISCLSCGSLAGASRSTSSATGHHTETNSQ